ncbi:phage scaffolding protein [Desemzia sp. C1]|uniref:phage scaffolding protein n=1 Tax=Desemzia sp. C1 TaxID=2892016 RepID=UPI001E4C1163|nr:phage scaffolding protein [Desemzia sp. C1]MCI3029765.1 phage scaffolding protein [Desemzia sp. C1]
MNENQLIKLGLNKEQASSVLSMHKKSIDGNYVPKARFDQINDAKKALEGSNGSTTDYEAEISRLTKENNTLKETHANELNELKLSQNVDLALSKSKAKDVNLVKRLLNMDEVKFDKKGSLIGLDDQIENLRKGESTSSLFEKEKVPTFKGARPASGQNRNVGMPDITKMSYAQLDEYMRNNK